MKFKKYIIQEEYLTRLNIYGRSCEIFRNPTSSELRKDIKIKDHVRAFLLPNGRDIIAWSAYTMVHQWIREKLKVPNDSIPVLLYFGGGSVIVEVTDNIRASKKWKHNPKLYDWIMEHKYLNRWKIMEVSYYDEAIVGKWHEEDFGL
jgi:hypothetical protein